MAPPDTAVIRTLDAHGVNYRLLLHNEPVFTVDAAAKIQSGKDCTRRAKEADEYGEKVQLEDRVRETLRRASGCSGIGQDEPFAYGAESQNSVISVT
jgi:hypothetical protein